MVTKVQGMDGSGEWRREAWLQEIENWIDEGIRRTLTVRKVAKRQELEALRVRVERIATRIEALRKKEDSKG